MNAVTAESVTAYRDAVTDLWDVLRGLEAAAGVDTGEPSQLREWDDLDDAGRAFFTVAIVPLLERGMSSALLATRLRASDIDALSSALAAAARPDRGSRDI